MMILYRSKTSPSDMQRIPLTQDKLALIDDEDYEKISQYSWYYTSNGYAAHKNQDGIIFMHRLIMETPKGKATDHRNGNKLDNRKTNLRICNQASNNQNVPAFKINKSGYRGVHWNKNNQKWTAQISYKNQTLHIGNFIDIRHAVIARDLWALILHGEYAYTNLSVVSTKRAA